MNTPPGFRLLYWKQRTHLVRERAIGPPWILVYGLETHPSTPSARLLDADAEVRSPCSRCAADVAHETPEQPWTWTR